MTNEVLEYPLLTIEILSALRRKVKAMKTTPTDVRFIDHYLTSIGHPTHLRTILMNQGVLSFDDIRDALRQTSNDIDDVTDAAVTGCLLGCLRMLTRRVIRGEKIY
jgi:hypothetical protein